MNIENVKLGIAASTTLVCGIEAMKYAIKWKGVANDGRHDIHIENDNHDIRINGMQTPQRMTKHDCDKASSYAAMVSIGFLALTGYTVVKAFRTNNGGTSA